MSGQNDNQKVTEELSTSLSTSSISLESNFDDILSRMRLACGAKTDKELATFLGVKYPTIKTTRHRGTIPSAWYVAVATQFDVSMDWLRTGEGEMKRGGGMIVFKKGALPNEAMEPAREKARYAEAKLNGLPSIYNGRETLVCHDCEITMVPMVEARLSAGGGSWETSADSDRRYAFRTDFLRRKGNASAMVLMRVAGDSMEPEIKDNDVVLVDTSNTTPRPGRLFAIAVEDLVYLKKVDAEPGKLILTSANQAYAPLEIDARGDLKTGIRIIGKAVWVGRELD